MAARNSRWRWVGLVVLMVFWGTAAAQGAGKGPVQIEAAVESSQVAAGALVRAVVRITIQKGYHIQSARPHDDSLIATTVSVPAVAGIVAERPRYPVGEEQIAAGGLGAALSVYEKVVYIEVPLRVTEDAPAGDITVVLAVRTQACDRTSCLPPTTQKIPVSLHIGKGGETKIPQHAEWFAEAAKQQYYPAETATAPGETQAATTAARELSTPAAATESAGLLQGTTVSLLSAEDQVSVINGREYKPYNAAEHDYPLGWIMVFALAGGAILNIMPCVLPVIPLKVLSLVQQAHGERRVAVAHALSFSAGVISLFIALAIVLKVLGLFYGQQFQSTPFLIAMIMFVAALGLSMIGVWTISPPRAVYAVEATHGGHAASFVSGLMATLLATPCSAPYLGPVLAWALIQPTWVTALALGLVGVGMSLPYLLLAAFPGGLQVLPRAGRWSELLKQGLGIVMLGVAVYLLTLVQNVTMWPWILLGMVVVGLTCWGWGQIPSPTMESGRVWMIRSVVLVLGVGLGIGLYALAARTAVAAPVEEAQGETAMLPARTTHTWLPFNTALLDEALRQGRPVVVDWGADWCVNCRVLEAVVLSTPTVQKAFEEGNVVMLRADLSQDNPPAKRLNEKLGGEAIPALAIFTPARPLTPVVLRDNYTKARVADEVGKAR